MSKFKPFLAPNNEVNLEKVKYPLLASTKLDGYRCIFYKGEILTRSLKQVQNKQLREKLEPIRKYAEDNNYILDGEIYSHELTFQELNKFFMSEDLESEKSIKRYGKALIIPDHVKFYLFDVVEKDKFDEPFTMRTAKARKIATEFPELISLVQQFAINKQEQVKDVFDKALNDGYEGLILKSGSGKYKTGRGTIKEGLIYKVKPFRSFDGTILEVIQATEVDPNAEKKVNELGRSVTSKKLQDRNLIEKASAFKVNYEDTTVKVVLAMTDEEKEEVWANREDYIGKVIEYKGMLVGAKDVPRHPVMLRFIDPETK